MSKLFSALIAAIGMMMPGTESPWSLAPLRRGTAQRRYRRVGPKGHPGNKLARKASQGRLGIAVLR